MLQHGSKTYSYCRISANSVAPVKKIINTKKLLTICDHSRSRNVTIALCWALLDFTTFPGKMCSSVLHISRRI